MGNKRAMKSLITTDQLMAIWREVEVGAGSEIQADYEQWGTGENS